MLIWLISPYGPIPGEGWRDYRYTMMGDTLAEAGHEVIWWTSSFSHHFKRTRTAVWEDRQVRDKFRIRLVPACGYSRNIGFGRLRHELLFVRHLDQRARTERPPECLIATEPPQTVGWLGARLARRWNCPLIFDVMDLWPEQFTLALPPKLRAFAPGFFAPLVAWRARHYRMADGIIALCDSYLDTAFAELPENSSIPTATVFNGIDVNAFRAKMQEAFCPGPLPALRSGMVRVVFAGTLGENYDILALMRAAEILERRTAPIQIVVAGVGPMREKLESFIRDRQLHNMVYLGQIAIDHLPPLYRQCDIGVAAYGRTSTVGMPDKIYDYMAAGLPVVNSLRNDVAQLLQMHRCGVQYAAGQPNDLADVLEMLAREPELRKEMAKNSFRAGGEFDRYAQYAKTPLLVERAYKHHSDKKFEQERTPVF